MGASGAFALHRPRAEFSHSILPISLVASGKAGELRLEEVTDLFKAKA